MRRLLTGLVATLALAACEGGSPTAPPGPGHREYRTISIDQGPASLTVFYDQTWSEERARHEAERGLTSGVGFIGTQIGARAVPLRTQVFLQGEVPGLPLDTEAPFGEYRPFNDAVICADARGAAPAEACIAHQLQHVYSQKDGRRCWPDVLHYDERILELVPSTTMVTCEYVTSIHRPDVVAERVELRQCDTD